MDEEQIVEGLAVAMHREACLMGADRVELDAWNCEYDWVKAKWRHFAKVAISYLAAQDADTRAPSWREAQAERLDRMCDPHTEIANSMGIDRSPSPFWKNRSAPEGEK